MKGKEAEELLMKIEESFGYTKEDFENGKPIYTQWGEGEGAIRLDDLGDRSFKLSKNLGDIFIDKIHTNKWVVVGKGTTLHCPDLQAGEGVVTDFEGFLM